MFAARLSPILAAFALVACAATPVNPPARPGSRAQPAPVVPAKPLATATAEDFYPFVDFKERSLARTWKLVEPKLDEFWRGGTAHLTYCVGANGELQAVIKTGPKAPRIKVLEVLGSADSAQVLPLTDPANMTRCGSNLIPRIDLENSQLLLYGNGVEKKFPLAPPTDRSVVAAQVVAQDERSLLVAWQDGAKDFPVVALTRVELTTGQVVPIDISSLGRSRFRNSRHAKLFQTDGLAGPCRGVFELTSEDTFVCASSETQSYWHALSPDLTSPTDVIWTLAAAHGWQLEQRVLAGKPGVRSRLIAPDGQAHEIMPGGDVVCALQPRSAENRTRFIELMCWQKGLTTVMWDTNERRAIEYRAGVVQPSFYDPSRSLFAGSTRNRYWFVEDPTRAGHVLWRFPFENFLHYATDEKELNYALFTPAEGASVLARIDAGTKTYDVIQRYQAPDCPGEVTPGWQPTHNGRFVVVHCVKGDKNKRVNAHHVWSEVLDLKAERRWRTKLFIREIGQDGTMIVTDRTRHDSGSYARRAYVARW